MSTSVRSSERDSSQSESSTSSEVHLLELNLAVSDNEWDDSSFDVSSLEQSSVDSLATPEIASEPSQSTTVPGTMTTPAPTTSSVTVSGFTFTQRATKVAAQPAHILQVLYKKEDRATLPKDELFALQERLTKDQGKKKFTVLPLALDDQDKLEDTYNLAVLIRTTRAHLTKYDAHDVFTIIQTDENDDSKIIGSINLFESYTTVTSGEVAASIRWMREWLEDDWLEENMMLSYSYFENNTEPELWSQVMETYESFPAAERGGPLFFVLMMQTLLSCTEEASATLITRIQHFKITSLKGENITTYISLMRSAVKRLEYSNRLPEHINKIVLQGLQTSSVPPFNDTFSLIEKQQKQISVLRTPGDKVKKLSLDDLFKMAQSEYVEMCEDNTWTGITNPGTGGQAVFHAGSGTPGKTTCFNCGGSHNVQSCTQPRDEARILANKDKYLKARDAKKTQNKPTSSSTSKPGKQKKKWKWSPPAGSEKGRRTIDGKPYTYDPATKRWNPDGSSTAPATARANLADNSTPAAPSGGATTTPTSDRSNQAKAKDTEENRISVALANVSKSINTSLAGFADQFLDEIDDE